MVLPEIEIDDKLNDTFAFNVPVRWTPAEQELVGLLQEGLDDLEQGDGQDADEALAEICAELGL
jgi:hypothetical protein